MTLYKFDTAFSIFVAVVLQLQRIFRSYSSVSSHLLENVSWYTAKGEL